MCASEYKRVAVRGVHGLVLLLASACLSPAHAQAADRDQEQIKRLRLQIRQLQQAQTQAQEAQAQADKARADSEQALKSAQSGAQAAAAQAGRRTASLNAELQALRADNAQLKAQLEQGKAKLQVQATQAQQQQVQARDALAQSTARLQALDERHAQCRADNLTLHELGIELLQRYEHKGVGEALSAQEPFFQLARVRLENTVSQYRDKLDDARFKEAPPSTQTPEAARP